MSTELARVEQRNEIDVASLLSAIVKHGVTSDAAGAVKELVLLREHQEDRDAQRQWLDAFSEVRNKTKTINANKGIPDKAGNIKWFYAPLEDLQDAIEPILEMHGMTMRFDSRREGAICTGICWVSHVGGHEKKSECAINAANAMGGDLGALKIAKRGAMTAMFGLKTRHMDDDASILGDVLTAEQADELKARAEALGPDLFGRFMTWIKKTCGVDDFANIRQGKYGAIDDALTRAERKASGSQSAPAKVTIEHVNTDTGEVTTGEHPPTSDVERIATVDGFRSALNEVAIDKQISEGDLQKWLDKRLLMAGMKGKLERTAVDWRFKVLADLRASGIEQ